MAVLIGWIEGPMVRAGKEAMDLPYVTVRVKSVSGENAYELHEQLSNLQGQRVKVQITLEQVEIE